MTIKLTSKESAALRAIIDNALEGMGGSSAITLHDDNYSWFNLDDLVAYDVGNHFVCSALMGHLLAKGLIADSGERADGYGSRVTDGYCNDFYLTDEGIDLAHGLGW